GHLCLQAVAACTFKRLTGLPCPACGSTRAMMAAAAGHPLDAIAWNPLCTLAVPALAVAMAIRPRAGAIRGTSRASHWSGAGAIALLVGANWVYVLWRGN